MKIYVIKNKGATIIQNFLGLGYEMTIGEKDSFYTGTFFFRKKDAKKYIGSQTFPEYYEILAVELPRSNKDNRRRN
jgi:hypothetical protein